MVCPAKRSDLIKKISENIKSTENVIKTPLTDEKAKSAVAKALSEIKISLEGQKGFLDTLRAKRFKLIKFFVWIADSIQKRKISNEIKKIETYLTANKLIVSSFVNKAERQETNTQQQAQTEAKLQNIAEQKLIPTQTQEEIKKREENAKQETAKVKSLNENTPLRKARETLSVLTENLFKSKTGNKTVALEATATASVPVKPPVTPLPRPSVKSQVNKTAQQQKTKPAVAVPVVKEPRFPLYYFDNDKHSKDQASKLWKENLSILNGNELNKHFDAAIVLMKELGLTNKYLVSLRLKFLDNNVNYDQNKVGALVDAINNKIAQRNQNAWLFLNEPHSDYYYYAVFELLQNPSLNHAELDLMKQKVEFAMNNGKNKAEGSWLILEINKRRPHAHG